VVGGNEAADSGSRRRGRRPGGADTRTELLAAARLVFAEQGFAGATVRAIAARAGVDPAMVNHWFGGKQGLFNATVELPFDPTTTITNALAGGVGEVPERILRGFITNWDQHPGGFAALLHSMASQEIAARMITEYFSREVYSRIVAAIGGDNAPLRAALCSSQVIGLGTVRYVLKLEPLASASVEVLVRAVAPTLRRYLTADVRELVAN
jgi:AcrR family transcriptional regulator